jgi:hypothetical protein
LYIGIQYGPLTGAPAIYGPWREALAPLVAAPIPRGAHVVLAPPPDAPPNERLFWGFEAAARRPDLLWGFAAVWPRQVAPDYAVLVSDQPLPPGSRVVWRAEGLTLAAFAGAGK